MAAKQLVDSKGDTSTSELSDVETSRSQPEGREEATQYTDQRRTTSAGRRPGSRRRSSCQPTLSTSRHQRALARRHTAANVDRTPPLNQSLNRLSLKKRMSCTAMSSNESCLVDLRSDTNSVSSVGVIPRREGSEMPTSIAVTGLPVSTENMERLRNYFSLTGRSGGDVIQNCYWDWQHFIITYGSSEPVRRIRERRTHELCKTQLTVIPVELDDVGDREVCRTFSAACAPDNSTLSCLLHNYLVKVGVRDARFEPDEANRRIVVIVTSYEDIGRVQLKTEGQIEVEFEGRTLTLTRMEPIRWTPWVDGDNEPQAVYLARINCDFSDDDVIGYLEPWCRESDNPVVEVKSGETGRALVHFKNRFDFQSFRRWVQQHPFKADMVAAERVPASKRIRISNLCQSRDEHCSQDLADHFEWVAQRHRHHCVSTCDLPQGEVTEAGVQIFPYENCATVSFHCRPVLDHVLKDERCREFQGRQLDVSLDYEV